MDIFNQDIFTATELCTPEFLTSQIHFYHSGKHRQHVTAQTSNSSQHRDIKWSPASSSQLIEQLQNIQSCYPGCNPEVFLMGKYSSFFHKMRCIQQAGFKGISGIQVQVLQYQIQFSTAVLYNSLFSGNSCHFHIRYILKLPCKTHMNSKKKLSFLPFSTHSKLMGLGDKLFQSCHI